MLTSKSYSYDAYGQRIGLTVTPQGGATERYTYAYDVQGSVSLLLQEDGSTKAAYGYQPYGAQDEGLTRGDTDQTNPINPYRYGAKRFDSGSGSYDMGARRFGPDAGRFLQQDCYLGALADLGLALDPLTQNRYAFAGGNPLSYIERDGHQYLDAGDGGAASEPNPTEDPYPTAYADYSGACGTTEVCEPTGDDWDQFLDTVQFGLDVFGLIPVVGEPADAANAGISAARGDEVGAGASAAAMIPGVGMAGTVGKYADEAGDLDRMVASARAAQQRVGTTGNGEKAFATTEGGDPIVPSGYGRVYGLGYDEARQLADEMGFQFKADPRDFNPIDGTYQPGRYYASHAEVKTGALSTSP